MSNPPFPPTASERSILIGWVSVVTPDLTPIATICPFAGLSDPESFPDAASEYTTFAARISICGCHTPLLRCPPLEAYFSNVSKLLTELHTELSGINQGIAAITGSTQVFVGEEERLVVLAVPKGVVG